MNFIYLFIYLLLLILILIINKIMEPASLRPSLEIEKSQVRAEASRSSHLDIHQNNRKAGQKNHLEQLLLIH